MYEYNGSIVVRSLFLVKTIAKIPKSKMYG